MPRVKYVSKAALMFYWKERVAKLKRERVDARSAKVRLVLDGKISATLRTMREYDNSI